MKRIFILLIAILVLVIPMAAVNSATVPWEEAPSCQWAAYHPGFAHQCTIEIMMALWDPLDWGD